MRGASWKIETFHFPNRGSDKLKFDCSFTIKLFASERDETKVIAIDMMFNPIS